jgi:hypothetical protein
MTASRSPFEALELYQTGEMSDAEALGFEHELFAAAEAGSTAEVDFVDRVSRLGQYLFSRGGFDVGSSRARVDALIAAGLRVQLLEPQPLPSARGDNVFRMPNIDADAEIVVTHLALDLRGYDSVDVVIEKPDGTELKTFREIGWDPDDGTVYAVCEAPLARISAKVGHIRSRVLGTRAGQREVVAIFETITAP